MFSPPGRLAGTLTLAAWQQVRPAVDDSPEARALYHLMFLADPALWYEMGENPRLLDGLFPER